MLSAINGGSNINSGCAIVVSKDHASLASATVLATGIAFTGTPPGGIVTYDNTGVLELNDWTMATGSKFLVEGATYYTQDNGRISPNTGGQIVGEAVSATQLNVNISSGAYVVISTPATVSPSGVNVYYGWGPPRANLAKFGDFYVDKLNSLCYGPKTPAGWRTGYPIAS